ncbi:MAG: PAS domain-containing protein [Caldilineaceae bacterium]
MWWRRKLQNRSEPPKRYATAKPKPVATWTSAEAIYNTAPIGLCVMDRELRYVRINDRLAAMNGLPAADHIGRTGREVLPDLADKTEHRLQQIFATGEPVIGIELSGEIPTEPGTTYVD